MKVKKCELKHHFQNIAGTVIVLVRNLDSAKLTPSEKSELIWLKVHSVIEETIEQMPLLSKKSENI